MKTTSSLFFLKKAKTWSLLFILVLFVASCSDDDGPLIINLDADYCTKTKLDCNTYLPPYQVGNYTLGDDGIKAEVIGTTTIGDKSYFVVNAIGYEETWHERYEGNKHFMKWTDDEETLRGDFSVVEETQWETPYKGGKTMTVKLKDKEAEIAINGVTFTNAYLFDVTISDQPTANYPITYLPGLGLVAQEYYVNGVKQTTNSWMITEFKIAGKVYKIK